MGQSRRGEHPSIPEPNLHPESAGESVTNTAAALTTSSDTKFAAIRVDGWQLSVFAVAVVGILFRWLDLGWRPLQADEAILAMGSLSMVMGEAAAVDISPLLINGNALLLLMFGTSDAVVRALPALAGCILVLLPLGLTRQLGKTGTLLAMVFLTVSPTITFASRHNTPEVLTAAAGLTLVICAVHYVERQSFSAVYIGAIALALLLTSGYSAYTYLFGFALYVGTMYLAGRWSRRASKNPRGDQTGRLTADQTRKLMDLVSNRQLLAKAGLLGGAVFAIISTAAFTNLRVIQAGLAGPLGEWFSGFSSADPSTVGTQLAILLAYDGVALVAAIAGAVFLMRSGNRFAGLMAWWMLVGIVVGVVGGGDRHLVLVAGLVPAALLAGAASGRLLDHFQGSPQRNHFVGVALVALVLSVPSYVSITFTSYVANNDGLRTIALYSMIAIVVAIITGFALSAIRYGLEVTAKSFAVVGLIVGLFFTFRVATNLTLLPNANPNEILTPVVTSPDVRTLLYDFDVLMDVLLINRAERSVQIEATVSPTLKWYLRDYEDVSFVSQSTGSPAVFIGDPSAQAPAGGAYAGQRYRITSIGQLNITVAEEFTRWLMFREASAPPTSHDVIVHVKTQ